MSIREEILEGLLSYPGTKILDKYPDRSEDIQAFWKAIWLNYLSGNDTNGVKWYEELGCLLYNELVRVMSHNGWVESTALPGRKWLSVRLLEDKLLQYVTPDELVEIKTKRQYAKYVLSAQESTASTLVRQNGKTKCTGLVRKGFCHAGNTQFGYDMDALNKYEEAVKLTLTKSMDKIREFYPEMKSEEYTYDQVSTGVYDYHKNNPFEVFTTGNNINDSRGRAISNCLKKVFNPIGSKDARSALLITYED
jgi:hypothetical protein